MPPDLVSKIAAGEVIERPASCVKELIENSIDAGAHKITCEVKGSGVPWITVIDDGEGMTSEEVELSVKPHTTSKLKGESDLWEIKNFGFRGEALPSMCRVAEVEISSRSKTESTGYYIEVKGGKLIEKRETARDFGTTVKVSNLFYNVPVRRKFLKSVATELRYITLVIQRLSIAYPDISFTLVHDEHEILSLQSQPIAQRITAIFGKDFMDTLAPVDYKDSEIRVWGYASKPYALSTTANQLIFVNNRPCKDKIVRKAVLDAYGTPFKDKLPSFIIFIETQPNSVDVNVHPRKEEVRFSDESLIYSAVLKGTREGLSIKGPFIRAPIKREGELELDGYKFWQLHNSYIFTQTKDGVLMIDQHAAHERVMYERITREQIMVQKLLFPVIIELSGIEQKFFYEFKDCFKQLGFEMDEFGEQTIRISAIPSVLKEFTSNEFKSMLLELQEYESVKDDKFMATAKLVACKSAIKSGTPLTYEEMESLVKQLLTANNPYFCPHGRPTMIRMTNEELSRKFGK